MGEGGVRGGGGRRGEKLPGQGRNGRGVIKQCIKDNNNSIITDHDTSNTNTTSTNATTDIDTNANPTTSQ